MPFHSLIAVAFALRDIRKTWESKKQFMWIDVRILLYIGTIGFIIEFAVIAVIRYDDLTC